MDAIPNSVLPLEAGPAPSSPAEAPTPDFTQDVPWVQQYWDLKNQYPETLLLYRLGEFYELFFEDAHRGAQILGVSQTRRGTSKGEPIPMAGFPCHALEHYLSKLVKAGESVAICEQSNWPTNSSKKPALMHREIVRVVTPGTLVEENCLEGKQENWLVAISGENPRYGYAGLELGSGRLSLFDPASFEVLVEALQRRLPSELLLIQSSLHLQLKQSFPKIPQTLRPAQTFDFESAQNIFKQQFGAGPEKFGLGNARLKPSIAALGAILRYLQETHGHSAPHLRAPKLGLHPDTMRIESSTLKNLEIFAAASDSKQITSLFELMDVTQTPMGSRCLRHWFQYPLRNLERLKERQASVASLRSRVWDWQEWLKPMGDLERALSRIAMKLARPTDLSRLRDGLHLGRIVHAALEKHLETTPTALLMRCYEALQPLPELEQLLNQALMQDLPPLFKEGRVIRQGYHPELDRWRSMLQQGHQYLEALALQEKTRWSLESLKVGYSSIYGYYFQLNRLDALKAPEGYERCQTLKHAERFLSPILKAYEQEILVAEQRSQSLERQLYQELYEKVAPFLKRLQKFSDAWSTLDACSALAQRMLTLNLIHPTLLPDRFEIQLQKSRHPLVEAASSRTFTTNDILLTEQERFLVITGPNMGGKSTYLRQAALAVFMSQIGSGVAASQAQLGVFEQIFTRIGASDDIISGRSTFMVEMSEVAYCLRHATPGSLIVIDEVGRGTTTRDGMAMAWAVARALIQLRPLTLFSTHFLEVACKLVAEPGVKALQAEAQLQSGKVFFLHRMSSGVASHAYGLEVAELAGVPIEVIEEAKQFKI